MPGSFTFAVKYGVHRALLAVIVAAMFVGCGENNQMVVMDSTNGNILATLPIGPRCDGCAFDPGTDSAFAACGDGTVAVVRKNGDGKFEVSQTVQTKPGARTIGVDPVVHVLYLPTAET